MAIGRYGKDEEIAGFVTYLAGRRRVISPAPV